MGCLAHSHCFNRPHIGIDVISGEQKETRRLREGLCVDGSAGVLAENRDPCSRRESDATRFTLLSTRPAQNILVSGDNTST